jgi:hypothetical protein
MQGLFWCLRSFSFSFVAPTKKIKNTLGKGRKAQRSVIFFIAALRAEGESSVSFGRIINMDCHTKTHLFLVSSEGVQRWLKMSSEHGLRSTMETRSKENIA